MAEEKITLRVRRARTGEPHKKYFVQHIEMHTEEDRIWLRNWFANKRLQTGLPAGKLIMLMAKNYVHKKED